MVNSEESLVLLSGHWMSANC